MVSRPPIDEADLGIAPPFKAEKSVPTLDAFPSATPKNNSFLSLQLWLIVYIVLIGVAAFAALNFHSSHALTAFGDLTQLFLVGSSAGVMFANGLSTRGRVRVF